MTDFDYKKHSLQRLEDWVCDAMDTADASPQEIYDTIIGMVEEQVKYYKKGFDKSTDLLSLLKGHRSVNFDIPTTSETVTSGASKSPDPCMPPWSYSDLEYVSKYSSCNKDDSSPECKGAWNSFWEEKNYPEEYGLQYTDEEITAMCDAAEKVEKERLKSELLDAKINAKSSFNDGLTREYYQDRVTQLEDQLGVVKKDKVKKWVLPVEECKDADTDETEYFIQFPDDLLEAANLEEGDQVEWIFNGDNSYTLKKIINKDT
jgi:hypothetical protein